jgi:hypothetical protein
MRVLFVLSVSDKQKKQIVEKHSLLGKSNPFYFSHTFFSYIFGLICLCKQFTCIMGLASTLASTGDCFFHFSEKKYKKQ